jgi:hypothetical protein
MFITYKNAINNYLKITVTIHIFPIIIIIILYLKQYFNNLVTFKLWFKALHVMCNVYYFFLNEVILYIENLICL